MYQYHYDEIKSDGRRVHIITIEDDHDTVRLTEADARFEELAQRKATDRGIVVWFEKKH